MGKTGKFENRKESAGKKSTANKLLIQTYLISLLSLVMCVTLFFGTSYAWFSSEVTNTSNEIYVGTLKVGLYGKGGRDLTSTNNTLFDKDIRWEPGYTTLDTLQISNQGDLAFKYVLSFTDGSLTGGNAKILDDVAKYFEVWVFDHQKNGAPSPQSYADITEGNGWTSAGTLDMLLSGTPVLSGELKNGENMPENDSSAATDHTYTVALHMKESANADVIGCRIKLSVKLVAYQLISEADVFGNSNYDEMVSVSNRKELTEALAADKNVILVSNLTVGSKDDCLKMDGGVLDGGKNSVSYTGGKTANDKPVEVMTVSGGAIQNLNIKAGSNGHALYVNKLEANLEITDCNLSGEHSFYSDGDTESTYTATFTDTYFNDTVSYENAMKHVYFKDCSFAQLLTVGGDTTLTDCTFGWQSLDVSALKSGETVTLINCDYKNVSVARAVLTAGDSGVSITGTDALTIQDNMLVSK